jgi:hypothetical protein
MHRLLTALSFLFSLFVPNACLSDVLEGGAISCTEITYSETGRFFRQKLLEIGSEPEHSDIGVALRSSPVTVRVSDCETFYVATVINRTPNKTGERSYFMGFYFTIIFSKRSFDVLEGAQYIVFVNGEM